MVLVVIKCADFLCCLPGNTADVLCCLQGNIIWLKPHFHTETVTWELRAAIRKPARGAAILPDLEFLIRP